MTFPRDITQGVPAEYGIGQGPWQFEADDRYAGGGWYSAPHRGPHYSVAQLERIALDAGATLDQAGNLATIAYYSESGGYAGAWNSSGATGLWQEEWPSNYGSASDPKTRAKLFEPHVNAQVAVAQVQGSGGYSAWGSDRHWNPAIPPAPAGSVPGEFTNPATGKSSGSIDLNPIHILGGLGGNIGSGIFDRLVKDIESLSIMVPIVIAAAAAGVLGLYLMTKGPRHAIEERTEERAADAAQIAAVAV